MSFVIHSQTPLTVEELAKVKDILKQSLCPHESLTNTFRRYDHIDGDHVYFDSGNRTIAEKIEI